MKWLDEQRAYLKDVGPNRYWAMLLGTVLFLLIWVLSIGWASEQIGWPEAYGVECRRKCLVPWVWNSPRLLLDGSPPAIGMFALLWVPLPVFLWSMGRLGTDAKPRKPR